MTTKHTALLACITMLQELHRTTASKDQDEAITACLIEARSALELPDFPDDFEFAIEGPDGIHLHPEPYENLQAAIEAAAAFPLRFLHQGYYLDARMQRLDLKLIPKCLTLECWPKEPDEDEDEDEEPDFDPRAVTTEYTDTGID
jgi:hypothetical protein